MKAFDKHLLVGLGLLGLMAVAAAQPVPTMPMAGVGEDPQSAQMAQIVANRMNELPPEQRRIAEIYQNARNHQVNGPQSFDLDDVAILNLPEGYSFINTQDARALLGLLGNFVSNDLLGMVVGTKDTNMDWFMVLSHSPIGYVRDQPNTINAAQLLDTINGQVAAQNQKELPDNNIKIAKLNWLIAPSYEAAQHRLSWLLQTQFEKMDATDPQNQGINYQNLLLSRSGFISANLATSMGNLDAAKIHGQTLIKALAFKPSHRYSDFQSGDRVAAVTLETLISGVPSEAIANPLGDPKLPAAAPMPTNMAQENTLAANVPAQVEKLTTSRFGGGYSGLLWGLALLVLGFVLYEGLRRRPTPPKLSD